MAPILFSCYFGDGQFPRLARVLRWSAARHCPIWDRRIEAIGPHTVNAVHDAYADNTHKLDHWNAVVQSLPDGAQLLLIDADTVIVRPLDAIWDQSFDLAYTVRPPNYKLPLNGGVIFLRVSARSKAFVNAWAMVNRQMVGDRGLHNKWRRQFGGINQAAFGCVLSSTTNLELLKLPCLEWNCEDSGWGDFSPSVTRILHVKSLLRRVVFNLGGPTPAVRAVTKFWRAVERESQALPI